MGGVGGQGVQVLEVGDEAVHFLHADARSGVSYLTVEVGHLDYVAVDYAEGTYARCCDILSRWTSKTTSPYYENSRIYES